MDGSDALGVLLLVIPILLLAAYHLVTRGR